MDLPPLPAALAALAAAAALAALLLALAPRRPHCGAPHVPGLPLLGNALALGRWGAAFLSACRDAVGRDAFCLHLGFGQRMVFLFDPKLVAAFMTSPEELVAFKPAVRRFTQRVYGLPGAEFGAAHETLLARLRHLLVPAQLRRHAEGLLDTALPLVDGWAARGGQVELWSASKELVFQSAGRQLFGRAFFDRWGGERLQETFFVFENFEIAASPVPHLLLPSFRRARRGLLRMLRASIAAGDFEGTSAGELLEGCGLRAALHPNVLLAVLWASQANSVAAMFWAIGFLLLPENAAHLAEVRGEVAHAAAEEEAAAAAAAAEGAGGAGPGAAGGAGGGGGGGAALRAALVRLALDRRSAAARCVSEAIRLRVHSVAIRLTTSKGATLELSAPLYGASSKGGGAGGDGARQLRVPPGTVLAVCPFVSHHDGALFGADGRSPWAFDPGRSPIQLEPGAVATTTAGFGFGGGFWRCPGRFFAEMELALLLMAVVHRLDLSLPGGGGGGEGGGEGAAADGGSGGAGGGSGGWALRAAAAAAAALLPRERLVFGGAAGGRGGGAVFDAEAARWRRSGDPGARLPAAELRRLVGFKVPAGELLVAAAAART